MSARRAEIEAKRARLAELRRAREERAKRTPGASLSSSQSGTDAPEPRRTDRDEIDALVTGLLGGGGEGAEGAEAEGGGGGEGEGGMQRAPPSDTGAVEREDAGKHAAASAPPPPSDAAHGETSPEHGSLSACAATGLRSPSPPADAPVAPARVLYTKEVQTDPLELQEESDSAEAEGGSAPEDDARASARPPTPPCPAPAPAVDVQAETQSSEYADFVYTSSKVIERTLDETYDVLTDYTNVSGGDTDEGHDALQLAHTFTEERRLDSRSVTDMDWSAKHSELLAVSYSRKRMLSDEQDGLVLVWNRHLRERPEFAFVAPTDVVSVLASPFHPQLFVGGTYSGQLFLWDTRHGALPAQRTPLALGEGSGHAAPVYSLRMVGGAQAHHLVSASTDGVVCTWSLDMLARPHETLTLRNPLHPRSADVAVSTLDFPRRDATQFLLGTEEGNVYGASRYDRAGVAAGLDAEHIYVAHSAPVTRLEFHPAAHRADLADVFLTSSMDWTSALWRTHTPQRLAPQPLPAGHHYPHANTRIATSLRTNPLAFRGAASGTSWAPVAPLARFESQPDYVMDIRWHPQHPALFAQIGAGGQLDVFNVLHSMERPLLSAQVPGRLGAQRISWERGSDERPSVRLAVGGMDARVHLYEVSESVVAVGPDDWDAVAFLLREEEGGGGRGEGE
ncbi:hypothetical protein MSPP1_004119 [Malassezia sp. CBS 17886]|nr:hypothetical protein MSPP1_004119 [Malassezia sp. CBS 17886]